MGEKGVQKRSGPRKGEARNIKHRLTRKTCWSGTSQRTGTVSNTAEPNGAGGIRHFKKKSKSARGRKSRAQEP